MGKQKMPHMQPASCPVPANLKKYQGGNAWPNPHDRAIYHANACMLPYHRGAVDYMFPGMGWHPQPKVFSHQLMALGWLPSTTS